MSKISNQLTELINQKKQLATNLNVKGVSANGNETLNTLVPKVLSIVGGSGDVKLGSKQIIEDGEYYAYQDNLDGYSSVNVNVLGNNNFISSFVGTGNSIKMSIKMLGDVPDYAFSNIPKIGEIDLTKSKKIGIQGCYYLGGLTKVIAPNPIVFESYALYSCSHVEGNVTISEEQTVIGENTFRGCAKLNINQLHDNITNIGQYAFYNCQLNNWNKLPNNLTTIGQYAFHQNINLNISEIPIGVKSISNYAFTSCNLKSIKIHDNCTIIGQYSFRYNSKLENVEIGNGITSMSSYCFGNCTSLKSITIHATTPPTLSSNAFYDDNALTEIRVPASALDTYKSATTWSNYADIMVGIEGE